MKKKLTDGYSGSDIKLVCKEAAMKSVRKVFAILENLNEGILNSKKKKFH